MAMRSILTAAASRLRRGRAAPTPPTAPARAAAPALITQDLLEHSTRIAQCLYDCNTLAAGQIITIEGYRQMVITVHDDHVTFIPHTPEEPARATPATENATPPERETPS